MTERSNPTRRGGVLRVLLTVLVCLIILGTAGGALVVINRTEPTAERSGATRQTAALVETVEVTRGSYRPQIVVLGTIEPAQDIILSPRVSGEVIGLDPAFVPGGLVREDQLLLEVDPADFETALSMRQSELRQVRASLAIEQGRQAVAKKELSLLDDSVDGDNRSLVLRQPQIDSIRAQVDAAQAAVRQARLDLSRTRITAPFDAQILRRSVNVGSQVAPGDELARLVGVDEYWVMATIPLRQMPWVLFPEQDGEGSPVRIRRRGAWAPDEYREGRVAHLIGTVDDRTRLARVLVAVADPLARETDAPPLVLGTLVETQIEGRSIENVTRLNRDYVRENDTVWVMRDGELAIRETDIVFRDPQYAYIREGLSDGEQVVTTTLATVTQGIGLRTESGESGEGAQ